MNTSTRRNWLLTAIGVVAITAAFQNCSSGTSSPASYATSTSPSTGTTTTSTGVQSSSTGTGSDTGTSTGSSGSSSLSTTTTAPTAACLSAATSPFGTSAGVMASGSYGGGACGITASASNSSNGAFINSVFGMLLHRAPDVPGVDFWLSALESGTATRFQIVQSVMLSSEYVGDLAAAASADGFPGAPAHIRTNAEIVNDLFAFFLYRAPLTSGYNFWYEALGGATNSSAATRTEVINSFLQSAEYVYITGSSCSGSSTGATSLTCLNGWQPAYVMGSCNLQCPETNFSAVAIYSGMAPNYSGSTSSSGSSSGGSTSGGSEPVTGTL